MAVAYPMGRGELEAPFARAMRVYEDQRGAMTPDFDKPFTQQEPINPKTIERVTDILQTGRLHRYNVVPGEVPEVTRLEEAYAAFQGSRYALAVTSGGQAMQIALRACGVTPGTQVLTNAYTLAPVPGAIHAVGAKPVLIETDSNWHIDLVHLDTMASETGAKCLMLSLMRGHLPDMDALIDITRAHGITVIEDCAHTMGACWKGIRSGNFGQVACFSTQTYKHINSGEGGILTTDDEEIAARAVILSGSYMLYGAHGARPDDAVFERIRLDQPNCSARLDNVRAALIMGQLEGLEDNIDRWNSRYRALKDGLRLAPGLRLPNRRQEEAYVGSSLQFHVTGIDPAAIPDFIAKAGARGVEIKWFGADEPKAFTSRFDSWRYLGPPPDLPKTRAVLATTCDIRVPLTFTPEDCAQIAAIIGEVMTEMMENAPNAASRI